MANMKTNADVVWHDGVKGNGVLVFMIELRELPVVEVSVNSDGFISYDEFKIIHQPRMVLSESATEKQIQSANRLFASADKGCVVGNLLKN
ncbi:UNVERIFIED_ORG: hypothetical protein J2X74_005623 [Bacillus sp. 1751]|nr:hypothetical protein [Bacillus sp. 1751]